MSGYYKCDCNNSFISDFPFEEANCLFCNKTIKRKQIISDKLKNRILRIWNKLN